MSNTLPGEHYCVEHQGNHSHYDPKNCPVCKLQAENERLKESLLDSTVVHAAMLRGTIAKISWRQHCHLTGEVFNGEEAQLAEIIRLRERAERAEAALKGLQRYNIRCDCDGSRVDQIRTPATQGAWIKAAELEQALADG